MIIFPNKFYSELLHAHIVTLDQLSEGVLA